MVAGRGYPQGQQVLSTGGGGMSLRLTPENLAAAYSFLKTTPPFCRWGLPATGKVKFKVFRHKQRCGDHLYLDGKHTIRISSRNVGHTMSLLITMAHEMVHVRCEEMGDKSEHGWMFRKYAAQVCKHHGFDPKLF